MPIRHADAQWQGTLKEGAGTLKASFGAQTRKRDGLYGSRPGAANGQDFDELDRQAYLFNVRLNLHLALKVHKMLNG